MLEAAEIGVPYLDIEVWSDTIRLIDEIWLAWGVRPPADVKEFMAGLIYDRSLGSGSKVDREMVEAYLKLTG
jgi:hypothetical protein